MINEKVPSRSLTWDSFKQRLTFGFGSHGAKSLSVIMLLMFEKRFIKFFADIFMPEKSVFVNQIVHSRLDRSANSVEICLRIGFKSQNKNRLRIGSAHQTPAVFK